MKQKAVLFTNLLLAFLLVVLPVNAQKKKKTTVKPKRVVTGSFENPYEPSMPEIKDFAFVINIDKNSNVTMKIQKAENTDVLTKTANTKPLTDFFAGVSNPKSPLAPILIVKADSSLNFSDVVNVIKASGISPKQKAKLEISKDFYVFVPPMPDKNFQARPNPLTMVAKLDENKNIEINGEKLGSLDDTSQMTNFLKQIFKAREDNGVYREGTNLVETTVFINASSSVKFADVIKLANVLREAGSTLIGLAGDDFVRTEMILEINK